MEVLVCLVEHRFSSIPDTEGRRTRPASCSSLLHFAGCEYVIPVRSDMNHPDNLTSNKSFLEFALGKTRGINADFLVTDGAIS